MAPVELHENRRETSDLQASGTRDYRRGEYNRIFKVMRRSKGKTLKETETFKRNHGYSGIGGKPHTKAQGRCMNRKCLRRSLAFTLINNKWSCLVKSQVPSTRECGCFSNAQLQGIQINKEN